MDRIEHIVSALPQKGWTKPEIDKAVSILQQAPEKKSDVVKFLDQAMYWILLLVGILANFIISIVLVPFLLVLTGAILYGALFFLGVVFGTMLDVIVRETEYLQKKHFIVAELLIPAVALINVYMITNLSNKLAGVLQLPVHQQPWIVAATYVIAFSLPHIAYKVLKRKPATHAATAAY